MSYDFQVYVRKDRLPSAEEFPRLCPQLTFLGPLNLHVHHGAFPLQVQGELSAFEVWLSPITKDDIEQYLEDLQEPGGAPASGDKYLEVLEKSDAVVHFACHSALEIRAAKGMAEAIARHSHGILGDPEVDARRTS